MVLIHPLPSNTGMFVPPNGNGVGNGVGGGGYIYAPLAPATSSAVAAQSVHQAVHGLVHKWEPPEAHQNNNNINAPKYPWPDQYLLFNPALDPYPPIDPCPSTSMANFPSYYQSLKQHEIPACYHQNPTAAAVAGKREYRKKRQLSENFSAYSNNSAPCPAISAAPEYFQHHQAAHHVSAIQHNPGHQWKFPTAVQEQRRSQLPLKLATPYKTGPGTNNVRVRTQEKYRMVYDDQQRLELEKEFHTHQFITAERKSQLSTELSLTERQIKIWFQNRRAKDRREKTKTMQRH